MSNDPIRGKTLRFRFIDGLMANKTFEHRFASDGTVTFRAVNADVKTGAPSEGSAEKPLINYEVVPIRDDIYAVAYLSKGYTLTTILDFKTKKLVAFSSNEKMVSSQHGTFDWGEQPTTGDSRPEGARAH